MGLSFSGSSTMRMIAGSVYGFQMLGAAGAETALAVLGKMRPGLDFHHVLVFPILRRALEDHIQNAKAKSALDTIKEAA